MSVEQNGAAGTPSAGTGETGGGTPSPTPTTSPSGTPQASQPAAGTPAAGQPAATPAQRRFEYQEDRSNWVPPHRLRETSTRVQQLERELYAQQQRVAALAGVQPPQAPEDPETAAIRQQFERLYPGLAKLNERAERLAALAEMDPQSMTSAQEHYWESLGRQTFNRLDEKVQSLIGGELTPFARRTMQSAFAAYIQSDQDLAVRYAGQDPKLLDDFLKEYQTGFLDPYRRTITTQQAPRHERVRNLPRGGNSTAIPGGGPAQLKPADTDEYHGAAFRAFTQGNG
jgi:hypothetical protein